MNRILIAGILAGLFYLIIPGIGAFIVRGRWRQFRRRLLHTSSLPQITYSLVRSAVDGYLGSFRFYGTLQAIQGDDVVWVGDGTVTLKVEMSGISVYELPSDSYIHERSGVEYYEEPLPDEMPREMAWEQIFSLSEGTKMLISGPVYVEDGHGIFRSAESRPLTVLLYDGSESTILKRSIWSGRQRNEYWNGFTAGSLSAGFLSLLIYSYILFRLPFSRVPAILSLSMALIPVCVLLPPGLGMYYFYRHLWRRGRLLRAERDLLSLTLRYFGENEDGAVVARLIGGERYAMTPVTSVQRAREMAPDAKVRTSTYLPKRIFQTCGEPGEVYVFGTPKNGEAESFIHPQDAMAELVIITGNPRTLSKVCARHARRMEIAAVICFAVGLATNFLLSVYLLGSAFR